MDYNALNLIATLLLVTMKEFVLHRILVIA